MLSEIDRMIKELSGGERTARTRAVDDLVRVGAAAVPQLLVLARDGRWLTRLHAMVALARIGEPRVIPMIREALVDHDDQVRLLAAEAAGAIRDEGSIRPLCHCLATRDEDQRHKFSQALVRIGPPAVADLIRTAKEELEPARVAAVAVLKEIGDSRAIPTLRAMLQERKPSLQVASLDALVALRDREAAPLVVDLYRSGRFGVLLSHLVDALGSLGHPIAVPLLLDLVAVHAGSFLLSRRPEMQAIRKIGTAGVPDLLRSLDNAFTAEAAGEALLLLLLDVPTIPGLDELRKHGSGAAMRRATAILVSTGRLHVDRIPSLVSALEDPLPRYRVLAAQGLARIAGITSDPQLRAALGPLREGAHWYNAEAQQKAFEAAIRAIEASTASIAAMPAPACAPGAPHGDFPLPAALTVIATAPLPRAAHDRADPP